MFVCVKDDGDINVDIDLFFLNIRALLCFGNFGNDGEMVRNVCLFVVCDPSSVVSRPFSRSALSFALLHPPSFYSTLVLRDEIGIFLFSY